MICGFAGFCMPALAAPQANPVAALKEQGPQTFNDFLRVKLDTRAQRISVPDSESAGWGSVAALREQPITSFNEFVKAPRQQKLKLQKTKASEISGVASLSTKIDIEPAIKPKVKAVTVPAVPAPVNVVEVPLSIKTVVANHKQPEVVAKSNPIEIKVEPANGRTLANSVVRPESVVNASIATSKNVAPSLLMPAELTAVDKPKSKHSASATSSRDALPQEQATGESELVHSNTEISDFVVNKETQNFRSIRFRIVDDRTDFLTNRIFPVSGVALQIVGVQERPYKVDRLGSVTIDNIPVHSRLMVKVTDDLGKRRPSVVEIDTDEVGSVNTSRSCARNLFLRMKLRLLMD